MRRTANVLLWLDYYWPYSLFCVVNSCFSSIFNGKHLIFLLLQYRLRILGAYSRIQWFFVETDMNRAFVMHTFIWIMCRYWIISEHRFQIESCLYLNTEFGLNHASIWIMCGESESRIKYHCLYTLNACHSSLTNSINDIALAAATMPTINTTSNLFMLIDL